jgi:Fe-S cluster assembly ATPase SufC
VFAAGAADVVQVIADGRVVHDGDSEAAGARLDEAITRFWEDG